MVDASMIALLSLTILLSLILMFFAILVIADPLEKIYKELKRYNDARDQPMTLTEDDDDCPPAATFPGRMETPHAIAAGDQ